MGPTLMVDYASTLIAAYRDGHDTAAITMDEPMMAHLLHGYSTPSISVDRDQEVDRNADHASPSSTDMHPCQLC